MSPTRIQLYVKNPGQIQVWLEDRGKLFTGIGQSLLRMAGWSEARVFENRFSLDIRPERVANRVLASFDRRRIRSSLLRTRRPFEFKLGFDLMGLELPYEAGPSQAASYCELLSDIADAVEEVSKAPIVGIDVGS